MNKTLIATAVGGLLLGSTIPLVFQSVQPNHIVSVDPITFTVLTKYAFSHNITVTDTIALMTKTFPPQSVEVGQIYEMPQGYDKLAAAVQINCSTSTVGYNPIDGTSTYVYTINGTSTQKSLRIDKILFPDGSPDIVIDCHETKPLKLQ